MPDREYIVTINGKPQPQRGAAVLAALVASPFASDTAEIIAAVSRNQKFLAALEKAGEIRYKDSAKAIVTTGQALVDILPSLIEYHQRARTLAEMRKKLNVFRRVEWKKKRGRKSGAPAEIDLDLDL